jgi:hypothetical protein
VHDSNDEEDDDGYDSEAEDHHNNHEYGFEASSSSASSPHGPINFAHSAFALQHVEKGDDFIIKFYLYNLYYVNR